MIGNSEIPGDQKQDMLIIMPPEVLDDEVEEPPMILPISPNIQAVKDAAIAEAIAQFLATDSELPKEP